MKGRNRMTKVDSVLKRIVSNPKTFGGAPCIRDTRVRVETVLSLLAQGATYNDLMDDLEISMEDIQACIAYAVVVIHGDVLDIERRQESRKVPHLADIFLNSPLKGLDTEFPRMDAEMGM